MEKDMLKDMRIHTKDPSVGPWMLKELLGAGHQPGKRSTNPYHLGVVFERLPENLQRWWLREIDYDQQGQPLKVRRHLELVAAIAAYIEATARKCAEMLNNQEKPKLYRAPPGWQKFLRSRRLMMKNQKHQKNISHGLCQVHDQCPTLTAPSFPPCL
jgi:hypothetical protein